jgi:phospholipase/lecithinase/hemolysin
VRDKLSVRESARLLREQVSALRDAGVSVVVGTCPDLGAIQPIPQPLRMIAHVWSLLLASAQRSAVQRAGGTAVPLAALLSGKFTARAAELFSADQFHPNALGYELAVAVLLAPLCAAAGGSALTELAQSVETAQRRSGWQRLRRLARGVQQPAPAQPLPASQPIG